MLQTAKLFPFSICPTKTLSRFEFDFSAFDVGIVSSFALFIPPRVISQLPLINIHPSLLPRWRGPAPIQFTLLTGDEEAGVSIIDLHPKEIDAGDILVQESFKMESNLGYLDLESKLAQLGGVLAARVIDQFQDFWAQKQPQSSKGISKTRKISKEDGLVSFSSQSTAEIDRRIRAVGHQVPIKCLLSDGRTIFFEDPVIGQNMATTSNYFYDKANSALFIKTVDGVIGFKSFKIEGKSVVYPAGAFYANFLKNKEHRSSFT